MRRIIAKTLVLFILFANLAWAADMDEAGITHGPAKVSSSLDAPSDNGDPVHDGLKDGSCDHCCHGTAHYFGFPAGTMPMLADCASIAAASRLNAYHSRYKEPPLQPPTI